MKANLVLIGNGMAGAKLLEELMKSCPEQYNITVFGNEPYGNYNRIMLSPLLAGEKSLTEIMIFDRQWYQDNGITLHAGEEKAVVEINRIHKTVIAKDGTQAPYDKLIIATGSKPFILPIEGNQLNGVMSFRDISDVEKMISATKTKRKAVVIGAGLLGLEAAMGLSGRGMDVTVVHNNAVPLNRQLDQEAGQLLTEELSSRGLSFKMNANTKAILGNPQGDVTSIVFEDGSALETDLVIMAIGIRPNIQLAQEAGIYCEKGIVVSDTLQTYDPSIYALGECIQHRGGTFGLVAPLYDQANVLANHFSEHGVAQFQSLPTATKLKVTGINLFSVGNFLGTEKSEFLYYRDKQKQIYKKLVIENNRIIGAVMYGETAEGSFYNELLDNKTDLTEIRPYLMFGRALCEEQAKFQQGEH
ncbi:FAD-dependent oxidoreductase [Oceaniserpentilla sp. 4NH20-0058]|uniref:NAD(P)/FAD-dependent oxidoreductase n=1 Tax=Oceaniserpentilla sp. 4NH20-0058 TaxID=3127660 RepID=UPI00310BA914